MNIAIFIYNRIHMYSGGQYHAFSLGKAIAACGHNVNFFWNISPVFASEFSDIQTFSFTTEEVEYQANKNYDYVIVAPSGFYVPTYYESALQLAGLSNARICLLNYESENWFNNLAPTKDDPRVWDYWRRVLCYGGLVISSTFEAQEYARNFYRTPLSKLHFDVSRPPINSNEANKVLSKNLSKDASVVIFVRPFHDYKGGEDLLKLSPKIFSGRILNIVFGGQQNDEFIEKVKSHYSNNNVTILTHTCISVAEKYILLRKAQVLLFPSYFEGFGYPPIEAFAVGTEVVCYDLPVLCETLGNLAFFAVIGNINHLEKCLLQAFNSKRDTSILVNQANSVCGFYNVGLNFAEILKKNLLIIPSITSYSTYLHWGPFSVEQAVSIPSIGVQVPYPPFVETSTLSNSGLILNIRFAVNQKVRGIEIEGSCIEYLSITLDEIDFDQKFLHYNIKLIAKNIGDSLLKMRLDDLSFYEEIIHIVKID
ncbi:glycosyltransferase family 4 protein [Spirosoma sp. SC4-14]|uniref:glycosyltransferase family 4 protein n=1 Tax=Spirosoma sp. SC4-14 TaxID=3128900 RepID=UPI0030D47B70